MSRSTRRLGLVVGCMAWLTASVVGDADIPGLRSRATLAAPDLDFELREAVMAPNGGVWAVVAARPRGNPTAAESMVLARFDAAREVTRTPLPLPASVESGGPSRRAVRRRQLEDIEVTADGRIAFALAPCLRRSR